MNEVLREKSDDETYLHAKFVKDCLEEGVKIPTQLAVSLLESKINDGIKEGKIWSLVRGFPENMEQLVEFKKKVSIYACGYSLAYGNRSKKQITRCFSTAHQRKRQDLQVMSRMS